jgi:hypothetical protein
MSALRLGPPPRDQRVTYRIGAVWRGALAQAFGQRVDPLGCLRHQLAGRVGLEHDCCSHSVGRAEGEIGRDRSPVAAAGDDRRGRVERVEQRRRVVGVLGDARSLIRLGALAQGAATPIVGGHAAELRQLGDRIGEAQRPAAAAVDEHGRRAVASIR